MNTYKLRFSIVLALAFVIGLLFAAAPDDNVSALTRDVCSGCTYTTIQAAVTAAVAGDTINVAAGTYIEAGQIVINKNLSIVGADRATTIVKPAGDAVGAGDSGSFILVSDGVTLNLSGVTIDGTGRQIQQGIRYNGSGAVDNVIVQNITATGNVGTAISQGNTNTAARTLSVTNSTLTNYGRGGIQADKGTGTSTVTITGNTITGKGTGDHHDYGIYIEGGASASISGNTITNNRGTATGSNSAAIVAGTSTASGTTTTITSNTLFNNATAIVVGYDGVNPPSVTAKSNQITGNDYAITTTTPAVDGSPNWFGSITGPAVGAIVGNNVVSSPWCGAVDCSFTVTKNADGALVLQSGIGSTGLQTAISNAPTGSTLIVPSGTYSRIGAYTISTSGLTLTLQSGVVIQNSSPCFSVTASNTTINAETLGGAKCVPTSGSHGITVAAGLSNIVIAGIEIDGATGTNGINFAGVVTGVAIIDNYIHGLAGDGVFFGAQPVGVIDIHGNLFQSNTGLGINAGTYIVSAEYNSWGDYDGPATATGGDGISASVDADPWTHVDLYMTSSGSPWANQVVNGQTITYTVMANLKNVNAADFTLLYPAKLTYVAPITAGGTFSSETTSHNGADRTIYYRGVNQDTPGVVENGTGLTLFSVTFTANSTVVGAPLNLYLAPATGGFGMPGAGSSVNVYAASLLDSTVNVIVLPTFTSADIPGYYLTTDAQAFHLSVNNANGGTFTSSIFYDFTISGAEKADITSLVCDFAGGGNLITGFNDATANLIGRVGFGGVGGTGLSLTPTTTEYTCTATFAAAKSYPISVMMVDSAATPAYTSLVTVSGTSVVYTKPTISSANLAGPYLVGIAKDFTLTVQDPSGIPEPFELNLGLPAGTTLVYNSTAYPCTVSGCPVPVTLTAALNNFTFTVTFASAYNSSVTANLFDSDWTPSARQLATYTQSGVVAHANGSITGTFSMQGRINRAGIPVTLTGTFGFDPYSAGTVNQLSGNFSLVNVVNDTYTITTLQPRYLNVTKSFAFADSKTLSALELKGGNAIWSNNTIDVADASAVGVDYGKSSGFTNQDADVNFDGKVNIFDLAMVGGNYNLTSATAYTSWTP
ncbi:MAG: hypothetical protein ACYC6K_09315 [Bellilinea sp.]